MRTYRRIAEILVGRGSTTMTPALVARICREAERKIVQALRADPVLGEQGARLARRPVLRGASDRK